MWLPTSNSIQAQLRPSSSTWRRIRMMFSWLTDKGILAINRAREVKAPKFSGSEGKTPAFSTEEVQKVLQSIDTSHVVGHRDKALLATLAYTFARIGAVVNLKVEDYFQAGKRSLIRFKEKGGKEKGNSGAS
jgi:site-specific recombinase XerD